MKQPRKILRCRFVFIVIVAGFLASCGLAANDKNGTAIIAVDETAEDVKSIPLTCVPKGEGEVCLSGFINNGNVMLNLRENLGEALEYGAQNIMSASFSLSFDCATKSTKASDFQFYDLDGAEIDVDSELEDSYKTDIENSWSDFFMESCKS